MTNFKVCFAAIFMLLGSITVTFAQTPNKLTVKEKQNGWQLLFDGKTFDGWKKLADTGWVIKDGELLAQSFTDGKQKDLITINEFENFELSVDFKISRLTNSGIKYLVIDTYQRHKGSFLGLEYQIVDNVNFIYPERGSYRTLASLYDLIPANTNDTISLNTWNISKIIVKGNHIEHWLNGRLVVKYDKNSEEFKVLVEDSKYRNLENFGENAKGHILLQNEGTPIAFRDIKIRSLE